MGLSQGDFQTQTVRPLAGPGAKRSFPAETCAAVLATAGGEAVPGLRPAELCGTGGCPLPIAGDVLKADNDHF